MGVTVGSASRQLQQRLFLRRKFILANRRKSVHNESAARSQNALGGGVPGLPVLRFIASTN